MAKTAVSKRTPAKPAVKKQAAPNFASKVARDMEKEFGQGTALVPDSSTILCKIDHWVSTRNFVIDSAISGGLAMPRPIIPFGRLTEISGRNGTGKTSLLGHIVAETQATGGVAAIIDTEQALDLAYFEKLGVDLSNLIVIQADTIEDVFTRMEALIKAVKGYDSTRLVMLGWDSLGGTPTKAQAAAESDKHFYAEAAKVVGKNLQRVIQMISRQRIALVFTNHVYRRLDVQYGDPWETYGGEKVKFYSTLRVQLSRVGQIQEGKTGDKQTIGHKVRVKVLKNKMAPMLRNVEVPCVGDHGFSLDYSVMEQGKKLGIIKGSTWSEWGGKKWQGWRGFQETMMKDADYPTLVEEVVVGYYGSRTNS